MGDKLPHGISSEGTEVPSSSPSNSLSNPPMARGGIKGYSYMIFHTKSKTTS